MLLADPGACTIDPSLFSNSSASFDMERRISAGADVMHNPTKSVQILSGPITGTPDSDVIILHEGSEMVIKARPIWHFYKFHST